MHTPDTLGKPSIDILDTEDSVIACSPLVRVEIGGILRNHPVWALLRDKPVESSIETPELERRESVPVVGQVCGRRPATQAAAIFEPDACLTRLQLHFRTGSVQAFIPGYPPHPLV